MRIENNEMLNSINLYQTDPVAGKGEVVKQQEKPQAPAQDRVQLSTTKTEIERLKKAVDELPEVRTDKVEVFKQQLADGSYRVESTKVAEKILEQFTGTGFSGGSK